MQSTQATICTIDGCDLPVKRPTTGLCYGHYMKQWRYGDPLHVPFVPKVDLTGQRFGMLTVEAYEHRTGRATPSTWRCRCDCGETTSVRTGDLNSGNVTSCGDPTHRWQEDIEYGAAHCRVRFHRGPASEQACVDCGGTASHWSYDHADPGERTSAVLKGGPAYSLDPEHYVPRCVPCHKRFDLDHIAA